MMKHILASTALVTLFASGAYAQTEPAADPAADPAAPIVEGADGAAEPTTEGASPDVVQDDTATPDAEAPPEIVETEPLDGEADTMATDEAAPLDGDADALATDEAAPLDGDADALATDDAAPLDGDADALATDDAAPLDGEADALATDDAAPLDGDADTMATDEVAPLDGDADALATDDAAPLDGAADTMAADGEFAPIDLATFSTDRLIGADIVTAEDETIATIEDVIISDTGEVESLVAQFGGFLGFGADRVLLTMDEIEVMQDANETLLVRTTLTPEGMEGRPVYEE